MSSGAPMRSSTSPVLPPSPSRLGSVGRCKRNKGATSDGNEEAVRPLPPHLGDSDHYLDITTEDTGCRTDGVVHIIGIGSPTTSRSMSLGSPPSCPT